MRNIYVTSEPKCQTNTLEQIRKTLCVLVSFISVDLSMLLSSADTLRGTSRGIQVLVLNSEIYNALYLKKDMCAVRDIMDVIKKK